MTIVHPLDPTGLTLKSGSHDSESPGDWCVMEAAAWMAGEAWTDHPTCVSPVLGAFMRTWNDNLPDDEARTRHLARYLTPVPDGVIGTAPTSAEVEERRAWLAFDWLVRVHTPAWLRLAGLTAQADMLAGLSELVSTEQAVSIKPALEAIRKDAHAAWAAAWAAARAAAGAAARVAAGDAAWVAARDAAGDAARDAAGDAARDAAGAAAWDAAGAAAGAAAWDAAWVAAGAAAWDAAWDAAGAAAWDAARAAAWAAARDALQPTVVELQGSAHELVVRMIRADA